MADELELDLEQLDAQIENTNKVEQRFKTLTSTLKEKEAQNEELSKAKAEIEAQKAAAEKEAAFYKDFSTAAVKYPQSAELQEKIREKYVAGYSMEDAFVSVLNAEGKLSPQQEQVQQPMQTMNPAGGSAINQTQLGGQKPLEEMSHDEVRQKLIDLENESGAVSAIIRPSGY